jgi:hypothetical protein
MCLVTIGCVTASATAAFERFPAATTARNACSCLTSNSTPMAPGSRLGMSQNGYLGGLPNQPCSLTGFRAPRGDARRAVSRSCEDFPMLRLGLSFDRHLDSTLYRAMTVMMWSLAAIQNHRSF